MKGIIALRMCDMSKYGGLPLEYGTVPVPVWRNLHPSLADGFGGFRSCRGWGARATPRMFGIAERARVWGARGREMFTHPPRVDVIIDHGDVSRGRERKATAESEILK